MSKENQGKKIAKKAARRAERKLPVAGADNGGEEEAGQPTSAPEGEGVGSEEESE